MFLLHKIRNFYWRCTGYSVEAANLEKPTSRAETLLSEEVRTKWEREQEELKKKVVLEDTSQVQQMAYNTNQDFTDSGSFYVAGVDISFVKGDDKNACAALVVLSYPELEGSWVSERCHSLWTC